MTSAGADEGKAVFTHWICFTVDRDMVAMIKDIGDEKASGLLHCPDSIR